MLRLLIELELMKSQHGHAIKQSNKAYEKMKLDYEKLNLQIDGYESKLKATQLAVNVGQTKLEVVCFFKIWLFNFKDFYKDN